MPAPTTVLMPIYEGVTQLDFTGPYQFFFRTPDVEVTVASIEGVGTSMVLKLPVKRLPTVGSGAFTAMTP